jgi:hypothetical protein
VNAKRTRRVSHLVTPSLRPGERIEIVSIASVRSVAVDRPVACVTTTLLSGTAVIAEGRARRFYVVMTNHRLLMMRPSIFGGPSRTLEGQILRDVIVSVREPATARRRAAKLATAGRGIALDLVVDGRDKGLRLSFGRDGRAVADDMAAALAGVPSWRTAAAASADRYQVTAAS